MQYLTQKSHELGAITLWDLAHSAGALPVDLISTQADFAVGCTYKYLNSGPGGPAFIYARPDHVDTIDPVLAGWLGHAAPFDFDPTYRPAQKIERMRVGTPPILQMAALDAALDVWDIADIHDIRARALELSNRFITGVEATCPTLTLASPRSDQMRGSQVSFRHPEGYAIIQALIARGVIGDFRAPDILRFGITPLYIDESDIDNAINTLKEVLDAKSWDDPAYCIRADVT